MKITNKIFLIGLLTYLIFFPNIIFVNAADNSEETTQAQQTQQQAQQEKEAQEQAQEQESQTEENSVNNDDETNTDEGNNNEDELLIDENEEDIPTEDIIYEEDINNETLLDIIKDRTKKLEERIGLNQNSETEQEKTNIEDTLTEVNVEKNVLEELLGLLNDRTTIINEDIKTKEERLVEITDKLIEEKELLQKNETLLEKLENEKLLLEANIESQKNEIENLSDKQNYATDKISLLNSQIAELNIYKKRYEEKIKEEAKENRTALFLQIGFYVIILIIYLLVSLYLKNKKTELKQKKLFKRLNRLVILEITSGILFVLFSIIYIVIINPGIGIIFVILGGSIIISIKGIISSFVSSFSVISGYKLGDKIKINGTIGEIKSINLLNTTISILEENELLETNKDLKIPNSFFIEKDVTKIISNSNLMVETFDFKLDLSKFNLDYNNILKELDNIFKKYNIPMIDNINKKRYYLDIKGTSNKEFEFGLKYYNSQKINNIKNDLILLINNNIKDDEKKDESNVANTENNSENENH